MPTHVTNLTSRDGNLPLRPFTSPSRSRGSAAYTAPLRFSGRRANPPASFAHLDDSRARECLNITLVPPPTHTKMGRQLVPPVPAQAGREFKLGESAAQFPYKPRPQPLSKFSSDSSGASAVPRTTKMGRKLKRADSPYHTVSPMRMHVSPMPATTPPPAASAFCGVGGPLCGGVSMPRGERKVRKSRTKAEREQVWPSRLVRRGVEIENEILTSQIEDRDVWDAEIEDGDLGLAGSTGQGKRSVQKPLAGLRAKGEKSAIEGVGRKRRTIMWLGQLREVDVTEAIRQARGE